MNSLKDDFQALIWAFGWYSRRKLIFLAHTFEKFKNASVEVLMHRRGSAQKQVWHGSMVGLLSVGILTSGVFGGQTLVSSTYPGVGGSDPRFVESYEPLPDAPAVANSADTHTNISQKPRSEIIDYEIKSGDTVSSIAEQFGISTDTIKWANDLENKDAIKPGQKLKILPVSGVSHTVKSGDTLQSVAKKYAANDQAILDFPFNDIPDDFSLKVGQVLIIPDGTPPEVKVPVRPRPQPSYLAQGSSSPAFPAPGGASFSWPTRGILTQYFSWYHPGDDIANASAPPVSAADGGTVTFAGWDATGYGNRIDINHGNGYVTRYAHLSNIYIVYGQTISRGQVIGQMGSTGRSTGTHLHFEIHYNGLPINPLSILQ